MPEPILVPEPTRLQRFRARFGRRSAGLFLALALEGLIVLALLTMAPWTPQEERPELTIFGLSPETPSPEPAKEEEPAAPTAPAAAAPAPTEPEEAAETPPLPSQQVDASAPSPWIELTRQQMAAADIAPVPAPQAPARPARGRPVAGPPDTGPPANLGDSERVEGSGPNGEPLYAAAWYRRPYDDELRGYLSTATGPGWGLIACRTVPQFRVEDCVALGESPQGSNIARAVLAAAWQFRVRPPQIGGRLKVGEWVRIRIDYDLQPR